MAAPGRALARHAPALPVALALGSAIAAGPTASALLTLALVCGLSAGLLARRLTDSYGSCITVRSVVRWTLLAFVVHLLLSLLIHAVLYDQSDAKTYHREAVRIVQHWHDASFPVPALPHGKEGFYYLLAGLFWLFGPENLAGLILNAGLAAALVPLVTDLTHRLLGDQAARYVPPFVLLLPGLLLWTSQLLKEAAVTFLIAVALNCGARLLTRLTLPVLLVLAVALSMLFTMRSYVGIVVAAGVVAGVAFGRPSMVRGVWTGVAAAGVLALLVVGTGVGYSGYQTATGADLEQANLVRKDLAQSARSGFGSDVDISTPAKALSHLPWALLGFVGGPFPWQLQGGRQLIALPDVIAWWFFLPSLWRGLRSGARRVGRGLLVLVLPAVLSTALLSLAVGNFGTLVRERSQVVVICIPLIALGLAERRRRVSADDDRVPTASTGSTPDRLVLVGS